MAWASRHTQAAAPPKELPLGQPSGLGMWDLNPGNLAHDDGTEGGQREKRVSKTDIGGASWEEQLQVCRSEIPGSQARRQIGSLTVPAKLSWETVHL